MTSAHQRLADLAAAGIDLDRVMQNLGDAGVAGFAESYTMMRQAMAAKIRQLISPPAATAHAFRQ